VAKRGDKRRSKKRNKKRRVRALSIPPNPHVGVIVESLASVGALLREVTRSSDPTAEVEDRIAFVVKELTGSLVGVEPAGTIEVIRMMFLPWSRSAATGQAGAENGASIAEVLALAFLGSMAGSSPDNLRQVDQDICGLISETLSVKAQELLDLTSARDLLVADAAAPIDRIAFDVKTSGKLVRSTSYPDMQADTLRGLFGHADVRGRVEQELGFSVEDAISFLEACHEMQTELLNRRGRRVADAWNSVTAGAGSAPTEQQKNLMRDAFADLFNPSAELSAVSLGALAKR
jgi:hypothetical protein